MLQCVAARCSGIEFTKTRQKKEKQCIAAFCVLQCVAVCCSVLQCVAVCKSVMQCGAVKLNSQ